MIWCSGTSTPRKSSSGCSRDGFDNAEHKNNSPGCEGIIFIFILCSVKIIRVREADLEKIVPKEFSSAVRNLL